MARRKRLRNIQNLQTPVAVLSQRAMWLDMARGAAIVVMLAYHFSYDLNYWQFTQADFYHDGFWLNLRTSIVSAFVLIVGISLSVAERQGVLAKVWGRRILILSVAAALISAVSFLLFQQRFIFFGVIHFIALASVLTLFFVKRPILAAVVGLLCLSLGNFWQHAVFDQPALQWLGMVTHKPLTEDYVPLLPWFGVVLWGCVLGRILQRQAAFYQTVENKFARNLAQLGQHSLAVYLIHQPVFFGILWAARQIVR